MDLKWWQRPAYIASIAALVASLAFVTVAVNSAINGSRLDDQGDVLEAIERNQAGVDELVDFVHDLKAEDQANPDTADPVRVVLDILCASSDPRRCR